MNKSKNLIEQYKDLFYFNQLKNNLKDCKTILDVGCGSNSPLQEIPKHFSSVGVDIFGPSIEESKRKKIHDTYKKINILKIDTIFKEKSFDAVICLDVIEHFTKKEALQLIKKMEKIAKKKVILLTPNGFYHQDMHEHNPYQVHKSGWFTKDLQKLQYSVYGLRGYKKIRGEYATIRLKPWIFWAMIAFISEPILYFFPQQSYHLLGVKHVS